eukprot:tig00000889_g5289.t1
MRSRHKTHSRRDRKSKLLVVDDMAMNRLVCSRLASDALRREGLADRVDVEVAADGFDVVEAYRRGERYSLILMDLEMPRLDGMSACRGIRDLVALGRPSVRTAPCFSSRRHRGELASECGWEEGAGAAGAGPGSSSESESDSEEAEPPVILAWSSAPELLQQRPNDAALFDGTLPKQLRAEQLAAVAQLLRERQQRRAQRSAGTSNR